MSKNLSKQTEYTVNLQGKPIKYLLDSAIVRDTKQRHFCCTLTCNKVDMGFDGASFSRMTPFEWKNKINQNTAWTFENSVWAAPGKSYDKQQIIWNFRRSYQILFYYRS